MTNLPCAPAPVTAAPAIGTARTPVPPVGSATLLRVVKRTGYLTLTILLLLGTVEARAQTKQPTVQNVDERGWVMFDDQVGAALEIPSDTLQQLRDMDGSYQKEYMALGNDPRTAASYSVLNERRNVDIKRILGPKDFARWQKLYDRPPISVPAR